MDKEIDYAVAELKMIYACTKASEGTASILLEWVSRKNCKDPMAAVAIKAIVDDWFRLSRLEKITQAKMRGEKL